MGLVIGGVPVTIVIEGEGQNAVVERINEQGQASAEVTFQCPYNQRYTLVRALKGTVVATGRVFFRVVPFRYPPSPNLVVMSVDPITLLKPMVDPVTGWVYGEYARLTVQFGVPIWQFGPSDPGGQNDPSGQPWTVTKFKPSGEVFVPPAGTYFIGPFPGGKPAEEASVGLIRSRTEISMTRKFLPYFPLAEIESLQGKLNASPMIFANRVYPPGFILFVTGTNEPSNDPAGNPTQDVEYIMLANSDYDWNTFQAKDGSWQQLNTLASGAGTAPFQYGDFSILP